MLNKLSVSWKICLACGLPIVALVFVSIMSHHELAKVEKAGSDSQAQSALALTAFQMKLEVTQVQQWLTDISATRGAEGFDDGFDEAETYAVEFQKNLEVFRTVFLNQEKKQQSALLDDLSTKFEAYYEMGKKMAHAYIDGGPAEGNKAMGDFDSYAEAIGEGIDQFVTTQVEEANFLLASIHERSATMRSALWITSGISMVVSLAFSWFVSRSIIKPLNDAVNASEEVAKGDLSRRVEVVSSDEFGRFSTAFNDCVENIQKIITEVSASSKEVASSAAEIAASSGEMSVGLQNQAAQSQTVSSAVEQMSASVVEVARGAAQAAQTANDAGATANEGRQVVRDTVKGMNEIADAVQSSAKSVEDLGKKSEQIGEIIGVINDIADQTNLLALNAAIEAARAGEHGRGFAVVADEVRKLAERTTLATKEVGQSIRQIQEETARAVELMDTGKNRVGAGVEYAQKAGLALEQIVDASHDLAQMVGSIATAAEQQSTASADIAEGVEQISSVTIESSQGASQTAVAAQRLSAEADRLRALVGKFKM